MLRQLCLLASLLGASALVLPGASAPALRARATAPAMQFGTGNYDPSDREPAFFLSPIPGKSKVCAGAALSKRGPQAPL